MNSLTQGPITITQTSTDTALLLVGDSFTLTVDQYVIPSLNNTGPADLAVYDLVMAD